MSLSWRHRLAAITAPPGPFVAILVLSAFSAGTAVAQTCTSGNPVTCAPPDSCTFYGCSPTDDCIPQGMIPCYDGNPCTDDNYCPQGQCVHRPINEGLGCNTDNCTIGGVCQNGVCVGTSPRVCDDHNACTTDSCDPASGCVFTPIPCTDDNFCTVDACDPATGVCSHTDAGPQICDDGNVCTTDICYPSLGCSHGNACDDGNVCTRDVCVSPRAGCAHVGIGGILCENDDPCTVDDRCVVTPDGSGVCVGTPPPCPDDGDACTDEVIDPVSCLCEHIPHGCAEAGPVNFADASLLEWSPSPDATSWNTYRGTIPAGLMGSRAPGSAYDHVCFESGDALGDGATASTDAAVPSPGTGFYYLVSGRNACAESSLGESDSGAGGGSAPIPNPAPCP